MFFAAPVLAENQAWVQLYTGATGTTAQVTGTAKTLNYAYETWACDIISSDTHTVVIQGNAGTNTTSYLSAGIVASAAYTGANTVYVNNKLSKTLRALVTGPSDTTTTVTINCRGNR
jgi:hypothetical protein